ncbi:DNA/RNA non-specific endonuclease [Streptomyces sp. NPDC039022]|uniref:DNA/RNA non-specific endonuclease n=1 Tax=Streptomyces sp. NPDC039022 TaxID=3157091 RepID=UPI0033CE1A95
MAAAIPASEAAAATPAAAEVATPRAEIPCVQYLTDLAGQRVQSVWTFDIDAKGRPQKATALKLTEGQKPRTPCETTVGGWGGEGFDGGHLIAASLNGVSKRVNLVPMKRSINVGIYKDFENGAKACLKAGKNATAYKSEVNYPDVTSVVPSSFTVSMIPKAKGAPGAGTEIRLVIPNEDISTQKKTALRKKLNDGLVANGCKTKRSVADEGEPAL